MTRPDIAGPAGARQVESADLVSVVVCFLDAGEFLGEAIASVYAQSHHAWELLLVDDGSTDASTAIAKRHAAADPERVRYFEHPGHENKGTSAARNLGIAQARGDLIAFLDADDVYLPMRLARSVELLHLNPSAGMVYGESEYWYSWGGAPGKYSDRIQPQGFKADRVVRAPELLIRYLTHRAALPCPTSITVRSAAVRLSGGFVDSFPGMHDDHAFLARFCLRNDVYVARECWDRYRQHDASICAGAARSGTVGAAQRAYLDWLRQFLQEEGMHGTRLWDALCYAERTERHQGPGWRARFVRMALRAANNLSMTVRSMRS
jgi:glycosyltransferase involved in cell wall biosynthesis